MSVSVSTSISTYRVLIRESHLDTFAHVNNATYLSLFEEARWDRTYAKGFSIPQIQESGLGPTILEVNVQFKRELTLRETVTIETWVESYPKKIGILVQQMKNEKDEICCIGRFTFGLFDLKARKLVLPTPEWLNAIGWSKEMSSP
jgi:thioesterase-3